MLRNTVNKVKNIFKRIIEREDKNDFSLGMPSIDQAHRDRRMNAMSIMKGGHGFRTPKKEPRRRADGTTRGERKRAARALAHERIHAERGIKTLGVPELQVAA